MILLHTGMCRKLRPLLFSCTRVRTQEQQHLLTKKNDRRLIESHCAVCSFFRKTLRNRGRFPAKISPLLCRSTVCSCWALSARTYPPLAYGLSWAFLCCHRWNHQSAAENTHSHQWFQASGRQPHSALRLRCCINCDGLGSASWIVMQSCWNNRKRNSDQFQSLTVVFWQPKGGFQAALVSKR